VEPDPDPALWDISPDGSTLIGSLSEISGSQKLVRLDIAALRAGDTTPDVLYEFGDWPPSNFVFSPDGKYLFGSSYYSGVSNIYRYDIARRDMQPLSNTETGFFKPVPLSPDSIFVFRYTTRGFVPSIIPNEVPDSVSAIRFLGNEIAATRPDVQSWIPPQDSSLNLDSLTTTARTYRSLAHLALHSAYPVVEGYQDAAGTNAVAIGARANFSDQVGATALSLTASYAPDPALSSYERLHLRADFQSWNWRVTAALNRADFYDLFGPTKVSRRGYSLGVQYKGNLLMDDPRSLTYTLRLAGYGGLTTLPDYQNVAAPIDRLVSLSAGLTYGSLRRSLGAVEDELGTSASATLHGNYVGGALFPLLNLDASHGFLLPLNHSDRKPERPLRPVLLRGLRQQLGGLSGHPAVPRDRELPGARDQRHRRRELRQGPGGVGVAAAPVPPRRDPQLLSPVGRSVALYDGARDRRG
jgi:hypothetical protein